MRKKLLLAGTFAALLGAVAWAQSPGVNSPFNPVWSIPLDSIKRTYSVSHQWSVAAAPTDIMQLCGNANNTVKLIRVILAGRATAVSPMDMILVRRSSQDNSANAISPTVSQMDTNDAAPTSFVNIWGTTGVPSSVGTYVAELASLQSYVGNLTTGTPGSPPAIFDFGSRPSKAPTLRGAAQCIAMNLSASGQSGNVLNGYMEWTEE